MASMETTEKLGTLECPINWNLEKINKGNAAKKILQRSDTKSEIGEGESSSTFQEIALFLSIAYLEYLSQGEDNKIEDHLKHVEEICEARRATCPFVNRCILSVKYVTDAMWAHHYFKKNNTERVSEYISLLRPFNELHPKIKAGIYALKSCCFMAFGPHDSSDALEAIKKAVALDREEAEWIFLHGKCLARTRRCLYFRSPPSDEELKCLEKALDQETKSPTHYVFCALSYQERGLNDRTPTKKMYLDKSFDLLKLAAAYSFDSPTSLARIARGFMRSFHPTSSPAPALIMLVENCVRRSYQLCPDSGLVNHVAGNFYFKMAKPKPKKYLFHLKKAALECGVYGAYINLFDMSSTHKEHFDVESVVNKFWEDFRDIPVDRFKALKPLAAYYLYIKKDYVKCIQLWREWLQSPLNTSKDHKNTFFVKCDNLTIAITNKVKKVLEEDTSLTSKERAEMQDFLDAGVADTPRGAHPVQSAQVAL